MTALLLDHLWQSSLVLAAIGLLTLFFRNNGAHVRHALWLAASLKFLLPFAALNRLGHMLSALLAAPPVQPPVVQAAFAAAQLFSDGPAFVVLPAPDAYLLPAVIVWIAGFLALTGFWLSRWRTLRGTLRAARASDIAAPMPVKISATLLEPGLVGITRPVLLLPDGITEKLSPTELAAIVAHETCHLRRRDNLTAALHMLVEALFWFWPPVWWLSRRLIAEREKACDEAVLATGNDPQIYAKSILKVCKHYVSSPLACAAGVSGANLKQRMEDIMTNKIAARLNVPKKALLAVVGVAALVLPLAAGVFISPQAIAQTGAEETTSSASRMANSYPMMPIPLQLDPSLSPGSACGLSSGKPSRSTHLPPPYPAIAQIRGEQGTAAFAVTVDSDGDATDAALTESSGHKVLDACAIAWVKSRWSWKPQIQHGRSVVSTRRVVAHFLLVPTKP